MVVSACLGAEGRPCLEGCLRLKHPLVIKWLRGSSTFRLYFKTPELQHIRSKREAVSVNGASCMFRMFLEATSRFLLNWQRSAPLWSAGLTIHILYMYQTGGSLCTCQQGGSGCRPGPRLSKVCHQFFLPCHQSYLIPLCFLWEAFLPHS